MSWRNRSQSMSKKIAELNGRNKLDKVLLWVLENFSQCQDRYRSSGRPVSPSLRLGILWYQTADFSKWLPKFKYVCIYIIRNILKKELLATFWLLGSHPRYAPHSCWKCRKNNDLLWLYLRQLNTNTKSWVVEKVTRNFR